MPFPFVYLCDLLDDLERPHLRQVPLLAKDLAALTKETILRWLKTHQSMLDAFNTDGPAVIAMMHPQKQTDRYYGLDSERLELVVARALAVSREQYIGLQRWQTQPFKYDLGACVALVMEDTALVSCLKRVVLEVPKTPRLSRSESYPQSLLALKSFSSIH